MGNDKTSIFASEAYHTIQSYLFVTDAPDAPTSLEIKELGSRQIQLLWKLPFSGNAAISQCTVQWRSDNGLWHDSATVGGDERQATIRGLKPTTKYWFKVRCQNMFGVSEFSNEYGIVTSEEREYLNRNSCLLPPRPT